MTDIFLSYSSLDRERVQPIRDALVAHGFDVFWDQAVPAATDWDTWIRRHLAESKCAVVAWSRHSVDSGNVRHEATMAERQGKLVPALIDPLGAEQFPMGLYTVQAANLTAWRGNVDDPEWQKLLRGAEMKLTPAWMRPLLDQRDAELVAERTRREIAERRDRTWREQIAKEAQASAELRRERTDAVEEAAALKARLEAMLAGAQQRDRELADLAQRLAALAQERDALAAQSADAERMIVLLRRRVSDLESGPEVSPTLRDVAARPAAATAAPAPLAPSDPLAAAAAADREAPPRRPQKASIWAVLIAALLPILIIVGILAAVMTKH
jgi:hypothetical protein